MAKDEVRVAGILSTCTMAAIAGVVWGQVITPPSSEEQREADEAEVEADHYESIAENGEPNQSPQVNELFEEYAQEREVESREAENEVPAGG